MMNISAFSTLDYVLAGFILLVMYKGWRRGLIGSIFSVLGAIAGALVGNYALKYVATAQSETEVLRWGTQAAILLISLSIGSTLGSHFGRKITKALGWKSFRILDQLLGVALSAAGWSLVIWTIMTTALIIPVSSLTNNIRESEVIQFLDGHIPDNVRSVIDNWRGIESESFNLNRTGN